MRRNIYILSVIVLALILCSCQLKNDRNTDSPSLNTGGTNTSTDSSNLNSSTVQEKEYSIGDITFRIPGSWTCEGSDLLTFTDTGNCRVAVSSIEYDSLVTKEVLLKGLNSDLSCVSNISEFKIGTDITAYKALITSDNVSGDKTKDWFGVTFRYLGNVYQFGFSKPNRKNDSDINELDRIINSITLAQEINTGEKTVIHKDISVNIPNTWIQKELTEDKIDFFHFDAEYIIESKSYTGEFTQELSKQFLGINSFDVDYTYLGEFKVAGQKAFRYSVTMDDLPNCLLDTYVFSYKDNLYGVLYLETDINSDREKEAFQRFLNSLQIYGLEIEDVPDEMHPISDIPSSTGIADSVNTSTEDNVVTSNIITETPEITAEDTSAIIDGERVNFNNISFIIPEYWTITNNNANRYDLSSENDSLSISYCLALFDDRMAWNEMIPIIKTIDPDLGIAKYVGSETSVYYTAYGEPVKSYIMDFEKRNSGIKVHTIMIQAVDEVYIFELLGNDDSGDGMDMLEKLLSTLIIEKSVPTPSPTPTPTPTPTPSPTPSPTPTPTPSPTPSPTPTPTPQIVEFKNIKSGDTIKFGKWLYSDLDSIEWIVLSVEEDRALLLSKYIIMSSMYIDYAGVQSFSWSTSDLREFLNDGFYNSAFNQVEKNTIIKTNISTPANPLNNKDGGFNTSDYVFIPTVQDMCNPDYGFDPDYNKSDEKRCGILVKGVGNNIADKDKNKKNGKTYASYWLRSAGEDEKVSHYRGRNRGFYHSYYSRCTKVTSYGSIYDKVDENERLGVRPAIYIRIRK